MSPARKSAIDKKFEYQGYWWLPDRPEERTPGILKFDPDYGATLDLLGSLKGLEGVVDPLEPEIVLGLTSGGKSVTLKDCGRTRGNLVFGGGFSTSNFRANVVFMGEHFDRAGDVGFERLVVEYRHLDAWAHQSGFEVKFTEETEGPKRRWIDVKYQSPESFTAAVGGEYEVTLRFGGGFEASSRPCTWVDIYQSAELTVEFSEKQPFDCLDAIAFRLQHLLSLGTRTSAYPVAVRGYSGTPGEAMPVEVHYAPLGRTATPQERPELYDMLFSRRALPGGFGPAVARWLEGANKLDPVCRLFLGTVYNPSAFVEQQFLSLVTALEVYHRRAMSDPDPSEKHQKRRQEILEAVPEEHRGWLERKLASSHEPFLAQRLHEIFSRHIKVAQAVVGRKKKVRANFIDEVVNARNYRAHFPERLEGRAARGAELHPFNVKLKKLLEACLMGEIGFGDDEIKEAVTGLR